MPVGATGFSSISICYGSDQAMRRCCIEARLLCSSRCGGHTFTSVKEQLSRLFEPLFLSAPTWKFGAFSICGVKSGEHGAGLGVSTSLAPLASSSVKGNVQEAHGRQLEPTSGQSAGFQLPQVRINNSAGLIGPLPLVNACWPPRDTAESFNGDSGQDL